MLTGQMIQAKAAQAAQCLGGKGMDIQAQYAGWNAMSFCRCMASFLVICRKFAYSLTIQENLAQMPRSYNPKPRQSKKTLVHVFITSRVDYCNAVFVGSPKSTTVLCNECWMQQLVSSQTLASTTVACRVYFMTSYTGSTFLNESSTSSLSWSAGVWRKQSSKVLERPLHSGHCRQQPTSTIS